MKRYITTYDESSYVRPNIQSEEKVREKRREGERARVLLLK
jgi:hypothetical protein